MALLLWFQKGRRQQGESSRASRLQILMPNITATGPSVLQNRRRGHPAIIYTPYILLQVMKEPFTTFVSPFLHFSVLTNYWATYEISLRLKLSINQAKPSKSMPLTRELHYRPNNPPKARSKTDSARVRLSWGYGVIKGGGLDLRDVFLKHPSSRAL